MKSTRNNTNNNNTDDNTGIQWSSQGLILFPGGRLAHPEGQSEEENK